MVEKKFDLGGNDFIHNGLWIAFEMLRGRISKSEYHLILFLLSIFKEGLFEKAQFERYEAKRILINELHNSYKHKEIADIFLPTINRLDDSVLNEVIYIFSKFDRHLIEEHFSTIFDYILYKISDILGKQETGILQPIELTRLINEISDIPKNAKVYNPFAGLASFGVFLDEDQIYFGQEFNEIIWAIGTLRLMAHGHFHNFFYKQENSITNWPEQEKFDLIVSNPPFGLRLGHEYRGNYPQFNTIEPLLIEKGIASLKETGKLIAVLPQGFLFRSGQEQTTREYMVNSDLLEMVVSIPGGLMKHTGIPFCVVILNKAKAQLDLVRFVDAGECVESVGRGKRLNDVELCRLVKSQAESDSVRIVTNDAIRQNQFNLNVRRYFIKEYDGVSLGNVGAINRGEKVADGLVGKYIRIRDLSDDEIRYTLDIETIESAELPKYAKKIDHSCILLAVRWKNLKPTYFDFDGVPVFISSDIISLEIDETKVDVGYLISELSQAYVSEQIESFQVGDTVPRIFIEDLLQIKIQLPSLSEQIENKLNSTLTHLKSLI
tara:strand:- start:8 stop:1654 length:1647 start_codon:yes stop_codon:yes gene_type:complete